jgi:hypothetical protein
MLFTFAIDSMLKGKVAYAKMSFTEIDPPISTGKSRECSENNRGGADEVKTLTAFASGLTTQ